MSDELAKKEFSLEKLRPFLDSVINSGGEFKIISKGTSMLPMLRDGVDTVVIVKKPEKLKKGDTVLYVRNSGEYVLHRIIKVKKDGFVMRGDNHFISEYPIFENQIIGFLTAYIRDGKRTEHTDFKYRIYSFYVVHFMPFRFVAKRSLRLLKRVLRKLFKYW